MDAREGLCVESHSSFLCKGPQRKSLLRMVLELSKEVAEYAISVQVNGHAEGVS